MKEYHKIETLWEFDQATKKFIVGEFHNPTVELLKDNFWVFTEKVDGTNFRLHWDGHKLQYAGRTDKAVFSKTMVEFINTHLVNEPMEILFEQTFANKVVTFYGELYGAGIQSGGLYSTTIQFKVFDIEIGDVFLTYKGALELATSFGLDFVPICLVGTIENGVKYVEKFTQSTFSSAPLEGLVGKPFGDLRDRLGNRIVIKIKRKDLGLAK